MNGARYNSKASTKKELQSQIGFYLLPPEEDSNDQLQKKALSRRHQQRKHHPQQQQLLPKVSNQVLRQRPIFF